jgi:hypothetical protein
MPTETINVSLKKWVRSLPASSMVYPDTLSDRFKYFFWRLYTPLHPTLRDSLLFLGLGSQSDLFPGGRQPYLLGKIASGKSVQTLVEHLVAQGFGNHFTAWEDNGQVVSLRYMKEFRYQYHLRIFEDGEVRAHYEYSPECHPVLHMRMLGVPFESRREEFLAFVGDNIEPLEGADKEFTKLR